MVSFRKTRRLWNEERSGRRERAGARELLGVVLSAKKSNWAWERWRQGGKERASARMHTKYAISHAGVDKKNPFIAPLSLSLPSLSPLYFMLTVGFAYLRLS